MTSELELVRTFIEEGWENSPSSLLETSMKYLSDDFQSLDQDGNVLMNKEMYIGMAQMMLKSFTGFRWVLGDLHQEGDRVIMTGHFEGTHTGDLDLSAMGVGVIPASGKMIVWPEASVAWKVEGGQISSQQAHGGDAGLEGFLAPLGVKLPSA